MENRKEKLVIEGNAFYELDMECLNRKNRNDKRRNSKSNKEKKRGA